MTHVMTCVKTLFMLELSRIYQLILNVLDANQDEPAPC